MAGALRYSRSAGRQTTRPAPIKYRAFCVCPLSTQWGGLGRGCFGLKQFGYSPLRSSTASKGRYVRGMRCAHQAERELCSALLLLKRAGARRSSGAPLQRRVGGGTARRVADRRSDSFRQSMEGLSKTPPPSREAEGQDARRPRKRGGLSLWLLSLYSGLLPSALRASFAVRTRSYACVATQRESNSGSRRGTKALVLSHPDQSQTPSL